MMKKSRFVICMLSLVLATNSLGQSIALKRERLEAIGVSMSLERRLDGRDVVQVVKDSSVKADVEPTFVKAAILKMVLLRSMS